jgi:SNF2 family DNA or RNA helicase
MLVVDESTIIKTHDSQQTKRVLKLRDQAKVRRILTGSPSTGSPMDLYPQFEFLRPYALGHKSWFTYRAEFCTMREIVVNGRSIKTITGAKNLDKLAALVERHSFRCRKDDCLDLPPKVYQRREIELTKEQRTAYKELKDSAMVELNGNTMTTQLVVTQLMRLHQIACGHIKWDDGTVEHLPNGRIKELANVLAESDEQVVIWCTYQEDIQAVKKFLAETYGATQIAEWHGGVQQIVRDAGEVEFQAGRCRFMLASQQSGARGRTWTRGRLVVYYSNNYDLELREQSEDRTHRIGQTGTVTYVDIVATGTVDEKIIKALRSKKNIVQELLRDGPKEWI